MQNAIDVGVSLMLKGHTPFIPHLSHHVEARMLETGAFSERQWDFWLEQDRVWLKACDALYFLAPSKGANLERQWAHEWHMPIYHFLDEVPAADTQAGHPRFRELLDEAWKLHQFKARKYGSDADPLANLHGHTAMGYASYDACLIELANIHTRIVNLVRAMKRGQDASAIDDEPLRNALMDNAAFSYLALILLEEVNV